MLRFYSRFALIPIAFFIAALLLIHAQPYDDHELRDLLLPEGCPAPCFMGIQPDLTSKDEAINLLTASGWVSTITKNNICGDCGPFESYDITWSAKAPEWLDHKIPSQILFYKGDGVLGFDLVPTAELKIFDVEFADFGTSEITLEDVGFNRFSDIYYWIGTTIQFDQYPISFMARHESPICQHYLIDLLSAPISHIFIGSTTYGYPEETFSSLRARLKAKNCRKM